MNTLGFFFTVLCFFFFTQAETRAEFAERTVAKLEKTIDDLEGTPVFNHAVYLVVICPESDFFHCF